ncbi:apses-domain-containing protein [Saccharata proteae CBS 121410]|uniref:Apses-domain-containing protein n=1 Tax=Saccharata proteae CBS 121410 TaxID=1314787 RepID=A0A9P4HXQ7_9PEZI|nr:apses-domain-containing protein [Saccharata proteae CBS 121410]
MQPYSDVHQQHIQGHSQSSGPPSNLSHYPTYQQPPYLQPGPPNPMVQSSYYQGSYGNGVPPTPASATMSNAMVPQSLPLPVMSGGPATAAMPGSQGYPHHSLDTTGQVAPPGMKPRVTATLWEDEGSLCFQVEAKGICVARREDNHFINGTKLLNVAGMTRGRRDGILKSEKTRHVVKIGPMHLKGVWIPFQRALDFANKEKITEALYPLFVNDIAALLYHPANNTARQIGNTTMGTVDRRRADGNRYAAASQAPSLHHHHSMSNPIGAHIQQSPHSIAPHPSSGRPGIDRAHTFPTPPTSASSIIGMGNSGNSYEWGNTGVSNMQGQPPLSIDTGLSNTRSVPTTPASTPPGTMQSMQQYPTTQAYDGSRQLYSAAPPQQGQYSSHQSMNRYGQPVQPGPYPKSEMAPPSRAGDPSQQPDTKPSESMLNQTPDQVGQVPGEEEADHEHDNEYKHDNEYTHTSAPYGSRGYGYSTSTSGILQSGDHPSPDMTGSPHHHGSGRATPRTTATASSQWRGYSTPGKAQLPSSNLYSVMSDTRNPPNGTTGSDGYPAPVQAGYPAQYGTNGATSTKRIREVDDDESDYGRPPSRDANGAENEGLKRRKTLTEGTMGGAVGGDLRPKAAIGQRRR